MFPCVEFGDFGQFEDFALRAAILDECQIYLGGGGRFRPGRINVERWHERSALHLMCDAE